MGLYQNKLCFPARGHLQHPTSSKLFENLETCFVVQLAAETFVDCSIHRPERFAHTNSGNYGLDKLGIPKLGVIS